MTIAAAESRRAFLRRGVAVGAPLLLGAGLTSAAQAATPAISARDHGARGDGRAKDTRAIQAAIDRAAAGGGTAHLPPGDYLSGTLHLRSGVTLRLDAGATLIASRDDRDFDPPERLGYESFADAETTDFAFALLRGRGLHDVAIVGPGRIDGNRSWRTGPEADRAQAVPAGPGPRPARRRRRQLRGEPARLRRGGHPPRHHPQRLLRRRRSRLLPPRADRGLRHRVARRRHRDQVELRARRCAPHRGRRGERVPPRDPAQRAQARHRVGRGLPGRRVPRLHRRQPAPPSRAT